MIPDFKTYINESIWSDIQKRSSGETIRKEDNIDLLDFDGFYKHIEDRYKNKVYDIDDTFIFIGGDGFQSCDVYFTDDINLTIRFYNDTSKEKKITFFWETGIEQSFIDELGKRFNIYDTGNHAIDIFPKEGKVSNSFFIEILEFILKNMDNMLIESIWSDIQKRSAGETIRKEDDINLLELDDFVEYLKKLYDADIKIRKYSHDCDIINVTILRTRKGNFTGWPIGLILYDYHFKKDIKVSNKSFPQMCPNLYNKLKNIFTVEEDEKGFITILPDKGEVTNKFYIDVINATIDNMDEDEEDIQIIKLNESIWSDIQKRSAGDIVRKEDEFSVLCEFIKSHYSVSFVGMDVIEIKDDFIHVPIYKLIGLGAFGTMDIYKDKIVFSSIDVNEYKSQSLKKYIKYIKDDVCQLYDKIKDTYLPEIHTFKGIDHWIDFTITSDTDDIITKKFCEEVIDFILENTTDKNKHILKILEKK